MRKIWNLLWVLVALFAVHGCVVSLTARADEVWTVDCQRPNGCEIREVKPSAEPRIFNVPEVSYGEKHAHEWLAYCKPTTRVDRYGVTFVEYAHAGCEFGKYE